MLFYSEIETFKKELQSKMDEAVLLNQLPIEWAYRLIQPNLIAKAEELNVVK